MTTNATDVNTTATETNDLKKYIRLFDMGYQSTTKMFKDILGKGMSQTRKIRVMVPNPEGGDDLVLCEYLDWNGDENWIFTVGNTLFGDKMDKVTPYFADIANITDDEWNLFKMCEPEIAAQVESEFTPEMERLEKYLAGELPEAETVIV